MIGDVRGLLIRGRPQCEVLRTQSPERQGPAREGAGLA